MQNSWHFSPTSMFYSITAWISRCIMKSKFAVSYSVSKLAIQYPMLENIWVCKLKYIFMFDLVKLAPYNISTKSLQQDDIWATYYHCWDTCTYSTQTFHWIGWIGHWIGHQACAKGQDRFTPWCTSFFPGTVLLALGDGLKMCQLQGQRRLQP